MSIDLSLNRIRALVQHLPAYTRPTCHIAGTNGKGSVSALLSSVFPCSTPPLSVGRFNSPHLVSVYDCITINNKPVEQHVYHDAKNFIEKVAQDNEVNVSNFELLTLIALFIFERAKLDIVVLEVGMGGRLDATNVIPDDAVLISALAVVDFDHQAFLGNSIAEIAKEKAAIARKHKPFVLGSQKYDQVNLVAEIVVSNAGAELVPTCHVSKLKSNSDFSSFTCPSSQKVTFFMPCFSQEVVALLPLHGDHQLDNLGLAVSVLSTLLSHSSCARLQLTDRITPSSVVRGIERVEWPGRLSFHTFNLPSGPLSILADGAHNPGSSIVLANYIAQLCASLDHSQTQTLTYVLALSHSPRKEPSQTLAPLLTPKTSAHAHTNVALLKFSQPEGMPWVQSVPPSELQQVVRSLVPSANIWVGADSSTDQLLDALKWAGGKGKDGEHLVIVAGSLYLVADLYRAMEVEI